MNRPAKKPTPANEPTECCSGGSCSTGLPRREALKLGSLLAAGSLVSSANTPIMAGPFETTNDYLRLISADKKLDPNWIKSLFARGEKEVYSDPNALQHIGMPVGGLFAGTVYLSGDGELWQWDIFNRDQEGIEPRNVQFKGASVKTRSGANYIEPVQPASPFRQGFVVRVGGKELSLNQDGFADVTFRGEYPRATVSYSGTDLPVSAQLTAFSPFIPLNADDSSLPATVMNYTVKNESDEAMEIGVFGHLQNPICVDSGQHLTGRRRNRVIRRDGLTALECSADAKTLQPGADPRPDIPFDDFEKDSYDGWTVTGDAFGTEPIKIADIPDYQGDVAGQGARVVNSHASAPGQDSAEKDRATGTLTSDPFTLERMYIVLKIGGGAHEGRTCVNLLIDGKSVASVTGKSSNQMTPSVLSAVNYQGQRAQLQIVDNEARAWGNIGVDDIVFTDKPPIDEMIDSQRDFGTMTLALLGSADGVQAVASRQQAGSDAESGLTESLDGELGRTVTLAPGATAEFTFVIAWHFPNFRARGVGNELVGHHYASRFDSASAVADYVSANFQRLSAQTQNWVETWYDSTLPYWFLDRTMANTSILATTTCYRFKDGRFWAWEGVGCCPGTCTHVWHYAQAPARLFPEIERNTREHVDFGIGLHADGGIGMRSNLTGSNRAADDGQCGRILGAYREHQMSADDAFLRRIWPQIKRAIEFMIHRDDNLDGILDDAQANTLDADWFGKISFLASLYLAALHAVEAMAIEMGEDDFAKRCRTIADQGAKSILELYDGEYFVQIEDPKHSDNIGVGPGCYVDQVFGQTWAYWVGLGRLFDKEKQLNALRSLYRYNFVPDVGPFREHFKKGRWYATAGDAGLLMCTWPKGGQNPKFIGHWQYMYFNECMSGFEWQAAAHMIWEGGDQPDLLQNGLAISRAIHDRYNASLRNPYNEIECSDHYSRSMASYGAYQAACGFEYHGPKGHIGFAPRLTPENFKCAYTAASAWGSFAQTVNDGRLSAELAVKWGELTLNRVTLSAPANKIPQNVTVTVTVADVAVPASVEIRDRRLLVNFEKPLTVDTGEILTLTFV